MSQIYSAALINLAAQLLPIVGIQVGSDQLTTTIQTVVAIVTGLWIIVRRVQTGDIKWYGARKASR